MAISKFKSILFFVLFAQICSALESTVFDQMMKNLKADKFAAVDTFLRANESKYSHDPDYYVISLNYLLRRSRETVVYAAKGKADEKDLVVKEIGTNKPIGFIGERTKYDHKSIEDGLSKVRAAFPFFPTRLDIRFGYITTAKELKLWQPLGDQLVDILKTSKEIDNKWTWGSINSMSDEPKTFMIENVQSNISKLFKVDIPSADSAFINASLAFIKYYPELIYGYSNLGVYYLAQKEYKKAEAYLKQAHDINPTDSIVYGNLQILKNHHNK